MTFLGWFAGICVLAFLVPFVFSSLLELHHDVYYLVYFVAALGALAAFVQATGVDVVGLFRQNWRLSLVVGAFSTAFVVWNVLGRTDSTPHPDGPYFAFEVAWRGALYGVVDALLLTALPVAVAYGVMRGRISGLVARAKFAVLAMGMIVTITAVYHLGYEQFREDGVGQPETGNTIISVPAIVSMNPLGSVVAHTSMHVAAAVHAYETDVFLPPQTDAD
jgi:hypothetical protein